jgi:hypothetical protein
MQSAPHTISFIQNENLEREHLLIHPYETNHRKKNDTGQHFPTVSKIISPSFQKLSAPDI